MAKLKAKNLAREILRRTETFGIKTFKENWRNEGYEDTDGSFELWEDRMHYYPHPILLDTWKSYNSLSSRVSNASIIYKVSTPYIGYHQTGYYAGNTYVPPRPVLYHSEKIHQRMLLSINEVVFQHVKGSTGQKPNMNRR